MLRVLQKDRILKFLNPDPSLYYKILILDDSTKDIISPLLKMNELRNIGITTYFMLNSNRQKIEGIPAIYFVKNTSENLKTIMQDVVQKQLYSAYFLNFVTQIDRESLEELAVTVGEGHFGFHIQSIFDQYVDFIALQNKLFTFNSKSLECELKNNARKFMAYVDFEKNEILKNYADQLYSVFLSFNEVPFILSQNCDKSSAEYKLTNILNDKFRNINLIERTQKRPLLIFLDRNFDMFTPVEHPWTYNSLVSDLQNFSLNKVVIQSQDNNPKEPKTFTFELCEDDFFWQKNQAEQFPVVSQKIEEELLEHKKELALKCIDDKADREKMLKALEKAPELVKKNDSIKAHTHLCLNIVEKIKKRSYDDFFSLENMRNISEDQLLEISEKGNDYDIIRLALKKKGIIDDKILVALLQKRKIDTKILDFPCFNKVKQQTDLGMRQRMITSIVGNVKKLLPMSNEPLIHSVIENIYNNIHNGRLESYYFKDPIMKRDHFYDKEISKIVVVVLGSGNYHEFNSLKNLELKLNLEIFYGCDQIVNAEEFIEQVKIKYST
ncbi:hypothetical protein EDEG_01581 [Edhazardia aedis USNM 41457]|uniref:Sec1 family protein n=1 Tax=Edhazardia aedis (strain USNM 41457) TaxID=1003232 RepID=J9DNN4_EDHAE|nr:hypothetical protein EDEG_01581 [Edhazardia aedis USNM 41457]|eukprot:EJW04145.1 hypothetical protein EDEG_01581 [Edhazardia aedis USNM 41457]